MKYGLTNESKTAATWSAFAILALGFVADNVTPDMLSFLGKWQPLIYGAIVWGVWLGKAYLTGDTAPQPTVTPAPATVVVAPSSAPFPSAPTE